MKAIIFEGLVLILIVVGVAAQEKSPTLSDTQQLKAQVLQLREQLFAVQLNDARCRATLADATAKLDSAALTAQNSALQAERTALEADIRKTLGAKDTDEVDWTTSPPSIKEKK